MRKGIVRVRIGRPETLIDDDHRFWNGNLVRTLGTTLFHQVQCGVAVHVIVSQKRMAESTDRIS